MQITFDPEGHHPDEVTFCRTKADWDAHQYSHASYEKRYKEHNAGKRNVGPLERAQREPYKFPCIAIEGGLIRCSDGPDEWSFSFLYNFQIVEENKTD